MTARHDQVLLTPLRRIETPGGPVMHGMKATDPGFAGFGEAYFSCIDHRAVKGWKRHREMTLNFVVPHGAVYVSIVDEEDGSQRNFGLGVGAQADYARLTIPPGLWVAFGGLAKGRSVMVNLASLMHDPDEADNRPIDDFAWSWPERVE